ncbi:MAG: phage major capsid protein [Rhodocyclaceae bacterium]|nr:MAG: phage major capsid protein [Rhodocyclaceae bacterium]
MTFQVTIENEERVKGLTEPMARKALQERQEFLKTVFDEAGPEYDPSKVKIHAFKDGVDFGQFVRNLNSELDWVGKRVGEFDELDKIRADNAKRLDAGKTFRTDPGAWAPKPADPRESEPARKSIGQLFVESKAAEAARNHQAGVFALDDADAKTLLERKANFVTTAGWAPESTRTGRVVLDEQREVEVLDYIPALPTSMAAIVYMEETTFTNAAAERAEAGAYAESALALTQRSVTVRSIGTSLPVSDEQLEDEAGVAAYLDQRLGFMVRQRVDSQVLVGDGIAPNLAGTLNVAGINTQALGGDTVLDALYKAIDLVRVTGRAQPSVIIVHPTDFQPVRLLKTADGIYIWGSPSDTGPSMVWGLPLVLTTAVTQNTAIVGDYARHSALHIRRGLELQTGYVNANFTNGLVTLRAGMRAAMVHYRPSAFTQITGI